MEQQEKLISKIYVITVEGRVIAYYAIFCSHLFMELPDIMEHPFRAPGVCLGMLGVDVRYRGRNFGTDMIEHSIAAAHKVALTVACRILYVEAYDNMVDYYVNRNFVIIQEKTNRNKMFFDLLL